MQRWSGKGSASLIGYTPHEIPPRCSGDSSNWCEIERKTDEQLFHEMVHALRQMAALQGLSGLFGVDSNLLGKTLGIPAELLNVRANASRNNGGFFSSLGSSLGGALGSAPGLFL